MKKRKTPVGLPAKKLRWHCNHQHLKVDSTDHVKLSKEIIGQDRAQRALRLGLEMKHFGYNVFVTGFSGTGRTTTIKRLLKEFQDKKICLYDYCYLYNFNNPDQPEIIKLKSGYGNQLCDDMEAFLTDLVKNVPAILESKRYQDERKKIVEHFQERQRSVLKGFEKKVKDRGFEIIQVQVGTLMKPDIAPVIDGSPVNLEQLEELLKQQNITNDQIKKITTDRKELESQMENIMREMKKIEAKVSESIEELGIKFVLPLISDRTKGMSEKYSCKKLNSFLANLKENILDDLGRFMPKQPQQQLVLGNAVEMTGPDDYLEFKVNVVVDNSKTEGAPVIIETNPKFKNIFGTIDREIDRSGTWRTDFTMIKAGSLLTADGGYLILNALDALVEPGVWQTLKRTLRNHLLEIQPPEVGIMGMSSTLKPEPIELDVKVVMIGDFYIYSLLYNADEDFKKIFKVRADFETEIPRNKDSVSSYISFIKMICEEENLLTFNKYAIGEIIEFGVRLSGRQNKLSTRFNIIADVVRESNYWAVKDKSSIVSGKHVIQAIEERILRVNLIEEKIQEMILDGTIMIDFRGKTVGQVNGLSVYDMGEYSFGKPSRITVTTAMGKAGVINIEREAELSGPTHNKGVLILSGYLRRMYAQDKPLVMSASVAFEQSYSGIDGDSASSTEIFAILSSLAEVPIRQDIAVTGSVNQKGEIQPIGGVNQKIEGFFDICKATNLTGNQGVIIPHKNVNDLMLRHDVVKAVESGKFNIYAIQSIDEGIEILTGIPAGKKNSKGEFPKDTIHFLVDKKLQRYAKQMKVSESTERE